MKTDAHPKYGPVIFRDVSSGDEWIGGSTKLDGPTETRDGVEYHVITLEISSHSHPFYTGRRSLVDTDGRVDKFNKRFAKSAMLRGKKKKQES